MTENRALTLIVVRPGPLRDGVEALMATVSQIEIIGKVEAASSALRLVFESRPDLLLLDAGLPGEESWSVLRYCRIEHPGLRCIVLADNAEQVQEASAAGADAVFLKGFPADKFVRTVERLLSDREERQGRVPSRAW
jgi:DNA-binding NarL/FixJ family response regulator